MAEKTIMLTEIDEALEVVEPIPVVIKDYGDEVFANVDKAGVYGAGVDEPSAISNLKKELKELFLDLNNTSDDKLGKLVLKWKKYLNTHLKKKGGKHHD